MERPKVMLAVGDDTPNLGRMLRDLPTGRWTVERAASGEEALALLEARQYGLILACLGPGGMDGFNFATRVRAVAGAKALPILLVAGRELNHSAPSSGEWGWVELLSPQITPESLERRISVHLASIASPMAPKLDDPNPEHFSALLPSSQAILWEVDEATLRIASASSKIEELLGIPPGDWAKAPRFLPDIIHPDDRERTLQMLRAGDGTQPFQGAECRLISTDGRQVWVGVSALPAAEVGGARLFRGMFTDVTPRRRMARQLTAFVSLGRKLSGAQTAEEAARVVVGAADELIGWDSCWVDFYDASSRRIHPILTMDIVGGVRRDVPAPAVGEAPSGMARRAIERGSVLISDRDAELGLGETLTFGETGRRSGSILVTPVRHQGSVIAVMSIQSYRTHAYFAEELASFEALADYCGGALAQIQAREALAKSEARFSLLFRSSPAAIAMNTVEEGRLLEVNSRYCELLGYSREELIGRTVAELRLWEHPEDRLPVMRQLLESKSARGVEARFRRKSGELRDVVISLELVDVASERRQVLIAQFEDVTEQRLAERAKEESDERFRQLAENIQEVFWLASPDKSELLYISPNFETIWGRFRQELRARPSIWIEAVHPADRPGVEAAELRRATGDIEAQYRVIRPDGGVRWVVDRAFPIRDASGRVCRVAGVARDITDLKLAELAQAREAAMLESISSSMPLAAVLDQIASAVEEMAPGSRVKVFPMPGSPMDGLDSGLPLSPAPASLADWEGIPLETFADLWRGAGGGGDSVVFDDLVNNPKCVCLSELAARLGLSSCRLMPALDSQGRALALLAILQPGSGPSNPGSDGTLARVAKITAIAVERDLRQRDLLASEERFRAFMDNCPAPAFIKDQGGRYLYANPAWLKQFDPVPANWVGKTSFDFWPAETAEVFRASDEACLASMAPVQREEFGRDVDGRELAWLTLKFPVSLAGGLAVGGMAWDITSQKAAELELRVSEERFRMLARATRDAIWDWNIATGELWWNEGFEELSGCQKAEIQPTLQFWSERIHPLDRQRVEASLREALDGGGRSWSSEYRFLRRDQSTAYVLDRGHIIRTPDGRAARMIGGMTDLTEWKLAQERLIEQATLLDQTTDAIFVCGIDQRARYWNRGAERLYGWGADEIAEARFLDLLHARPEDCQAALEALLKEGSWQGELEQRTKSGRPITTFCRWTLLHSGETPSVLAISTDITERKRIEQQLLQSQRMESIGTLAGGMAHDLNNVLAPILMSIGLLKLDESDAGRIAVLESMEKSAQHGAELVRQVLSFARGARGERVAMKLQPVVAEIERIIKDAFPKDIQLVTDLPLDLWPIFADPTQIRQVLMNLCVNARDAMPGGGRLSVSARNMELDEACVVLNHEAKPGPHILIQVEDTGEGISREVQERVFDPFFTTKALGKGTGLGLATVLGVVKSHQGFVNLHSEKGAGARFMVYLPAIIDAAEAQAASLEQSHLPKGSGQMVLVVDDEESIRAVTRKILERFGYRVVLASNGAEAVSLYARMSKEIDLVLTDMAMPIMDGPAAIVAIQLINPRARIIASSGHSAEGAMAKVSAAGVTQFVAKPYTAETLLKALRDALA